MFCSIIAPPRSTIPPNVLCVLRVCPYICVSNLVKKISFCFGFIDIFVYEYMKSNVSGYACNHVFLRIGNETLRPLEGARGTPTACPVSEA